MLKFFISIYFLITYFSLQAQPSQNDVFFEALKSGKKSEVMKSYLSREEMFNLTWMAAEGFVKGLKKNAKPKITKVQAREEYEKGKVYDYERAKITKYLDTFLLDTNNFDLKNLKIDRISSVDLLEQLFSQSNRKLTKQDSVQLKKIPPVRMISRKFSTGNKAYELETIEVKQNGKWKFVERPTLRSVLIEEQLDTVFYAALRSHFFNGKLENPYLVIWVTNSHSAESLEICIEAEEYFKLICYANRNYNRKITEENLKTVFTGRDFEITDTLFNFLKKKYSNNEKSHLSYRYVGLNTTKQILEAINSGKLIFYREKEDMAFLAKFLFNHGILTNKLNNNGKELQTEVVIKIE